MGHRSGFEVENISGRLSKRNKLLLRISTSNSPGEWLDHIIQHTDRQDDIFIELINRCPFGIYVIDENMHILAMNERSQDGAFRNVRPVIGRAFAEAMHILWPPETAEEIIGRFRHTLETGEPYLSRNFVRNRHDVDDVEGYEWELHRVRLPDEQMGVICYYYDSTELRTAQRALADSARRQQLLIEELNHRVKNTLAVVQALARQTFGHEVASAAQHDTFSRRLVALARAHDALTQTHWDHATLADVIAGSVDSCGVSDQVQAGGPQVLLDPRAAVTFALALHELCTNAIKYGALSRRNGIVTIVWEWSEGQLHFVWTEAGGPPVSPPEKYGFGTRMLERALAGDLEADVDLDYAPEGLVCTIKANGDALCRLGKEPS